MEKTKEYSNGEMTIIWKPETCIHSGICVKGLGEVFQPKEKPWIKIEAASTDQLIMQVKACPSGALSYYMNDEKSNKQTPVETKIEVRENGPLLVHGTVHLTHDNKQEVKNQTTAFCRCGASSNKPFCDGTHVTSGFEG